MKQFTALTFFFLSFISLANSNGDNIMQIADYIVLSNEIEDELVQQHSSKFTFKINKYASSHSNAIRYSINDEDEKQAPTSDETVIEEYVNPGEYNFQFLLSINHHEIFIQNLPIEEGHHMIIQLNFRMAEQEIHVRKPVIYLYPETETEINIEVQAAGELTFTYPEYNDGWYVTADSEGNITHNGASYNYLFWESEQKFDASIVDYSQGFYIQGNELIAFLESTLTAYGFTSKERADFITYWAPHMKDVSNLYIYFLFDEACDTFATLNISPEPAQTARFYMLWADAGSDYNDIGLVPQNIPKINRTGFTVLEWGGAEIGTVRETIE